MMNLVAICKRCTNLTFDLILVLRSLSKLGSCSYGSWNMHQGIQYAWMPKFFNFAISDVFIFPGMNWQIYVFHGYPTLILHCIPMNQRTSGLVNAHLISGPTISTKTSFPDLTLS